MPLVDYPLPEWVREVRPWQRDAVDECLDAYDKGARLVVLDAPTGAGKTLIAELVRRGLEADPEPEDPDDLPDEPRDHQHLDREGLVDSAPTLYVCSGLALQDQFLADFPYAKVVKGKANYTPMNADRSFEPVTCADCDAKRVGNTMACSWCEVPFACPYRLAKRRAVQADLAVVNTAYALREWSSPASGLSGRGLVIADECDTLESQLLGYCEFKVGDRRLKQLGLVVPKKGSHQTTIKRWMAEELLPAVRVLLEKERGEEGLWGLSIEKQRKVRRLAELAGEVVVTLDRMERGEWVRADKANARGQYDSVTMKPVLVAEHGEGALWRHGGKWLLMSATVISADQMVRELGLPDGWAWDVVQVPMQFPREHRVINYAGVGRLTNKTKDEVQPKVIAAVVQLVKNHPGERVLVHAVSYDLTRSIANALMLGTDRPVFMYANADEREKAIADYLATEGAVLVAPSLERGVDFKGDDCRVQVVAKIPYPYLGDKQVSARVNAPGGPLWYKLETIRTLVQMTGRGVRSASDWCVTYVLDSSFRDLTDSHRRFMPRWWYEAVDFRFNKREAGL